MRKQFFWVLASLLALSFAKPVVAEHSSEVRSLIGVTAVRVVVEDFNSTMQKTGLKKEQLHTIAQGALIKDGVRVLSPQESGKVPLLYIRLSSVFGGEGHDVPLSFYLIMQVRQMAFLEKREDLVAKKTIATVEEKPLIVSTWENGTMVMVTRKELFFYVKQVLTNLVGDFVRDQRTANGLPVQN